MNSARSVVLVEGDSDRAALVALARRLDIDLAGAGVSIVPMGGAASIRRFLAEIGDGVQVCGVCDDREAPASLRADLAASQRFVCRADLEDELVRATPGADRQASAPRPADRCAPAARRAPHGRWSSAAAPRRRRWCRRARRPRR
ncbi:MAG: ATP-dependent endonuclease [Ilumatobacteraceae bacterium]